MVQIESFWSFPRYLTESIKSMNSIPQLIINKLIQMKSIIPFIAFLVIISSLNVHGQTNSVLFVLSAEDTLLLNNGKKERQTGVFLNEFYSAYHAIVSAGHQVDFATPNGVKATIDQESLDDDYWKEEPALKQQAIDFWASNEHFADPMPLQEVLSRVDDYMGLVIPGGQGLMGDLLHDPNTSDLLKAFAEKGKAIGLICHAPALITTIPKDENPFIGYTVNSVTPFEEFYIERFIMKGKPKNRGIAKQLKKLGLKFEKGGPGKGYAVRDRNLVTSQNPYSDMEFNKLFIELLDEYN